MTSFKENSPYASALLDLGLEDGKADLYMDQLFRIKETIQKNPELEEILRHPAMPKQNKAELLEQIFAGELDPTVERYLQVLCSHRKAGDLIGIADAYEALYDKARNIERVSVASAVALDENQKEKLIKKLENQLQHKVRAEFTVDPSLIAGLTIRTENATMDSSVRGHLDRMKDQLMKAEG